MVFQYKQFVELFLKKIDSKIDSLCPRMRTLTSIFWTWIFSWKNEFDKFSALEWAFFRKLLFLTFSALGWAFWRCQNLKNVCLSKGFVLVFLYKMSLISEICIGFLLKNEPNDQNLYCFSYIKWPQINQICIGNPMQISRSRGGLFFVGGGYSLPTVGIWRSL